MEKEIINDEKRKKVIDELDRRKKIVENYLNSIDDSFKDSDPYGYTTYKAWYQLINTALDFVRDNFFEYNECDYSTYESYCKSIDECVEKSPFQMMHRIAKSDFNAMVSYIGIVIDDINDNFYPDDYNKIFEEIIWQ